MDVIATDIQKLLNCFIAFDTTNGNKVTKGGDVSRVRNCNGYTAVNTGGDVAIVNGVILYPGSNTGLPGGTLGDSMSEGGNLGEIYLGKITVQFLGTGPTPEVTIKQKYYILKTAPF